MGGAIFLLGYNYGMKTKLLTFLLAPSFLFLFSGSVFGQKTEVKKEYWGEGKLKSEKHYKDEKIDGFFTIWHKNGNKHYKTHFKDDKKDGPASAWYKDGKKRYEKNYKNGRENGRFTIWYQNGQRSGKRTTKMGHKMVVSLSGMKMVIKKVKKTM